MKKILAIFAIAGLIGISNMVLAEKEVKHDHKHDHKEAKQQSKKYDTTDGFKEGVHYSLLKQKQPGGGDKVEVIEFFSYACGHCKSFEPHISKWEKRKPANTKLTLIPVSFRPNWESMARAYYAIESMGLTHKLHAGIFNAIHEDKKPANTTEEVADIVESLGVDRKAFIDAMNSFSTETNMRRGKQLATKYRITGVPSVAINGKYMTSGSMAGSYPNLIQIIDQLVAEESKGKGEVNKKKASK